MFRDSHPFSFSGLTLWQGELLKSYDIAHLKVKTELLPGGKSIRFTTDGKNLRVFLEPKLSNSMISSISLKDLDVTKDGKSIDAYVILRCKKVKFNPENDPSHVFFTEERHGELNWHNRSAWEKFDVAGSTFTDPKEFDPDHFQLIVKGLASSEHLVRNPENIKNELFQASLVTEDHTLTYEPCGLVLTVPSENIFIATPEEIHFTIGRLQSGLKHLLRELKSQNFQGKTLLSPTELIFESQKPEARPNNIVILGTAERSKVSKVEISGVFFTKGKKCPELIATALNKYAQEKSLPVLELPKEKGCWSRFINKFYERFGE